MFGILFWIYLLGALPALELPREFLSVIVAAYGLRQMTAVLVIKFHDCHQRVQITALKHCPLDEIFDHGMLQQHDGYKTFQ